MSPARPQPRLAPPPTPPPGLCGLPLPSPGTDRSGRLSLPPGLLAQDGVLSGGSALFSPTPAINSFPPQGWGVAPQAAADPFSQCPPWTREGLLSAEHLPPAEPLEAPGKGAPPRSPLEGCLSWGQANPRPLLILAPLTLLTLEEYFSPKSTRDTF